MRGNLLLADKDSSIGEELPQMIVGPTVSKPEFEHVTFQVPDQAGRKIEANSLGLQPAYEAVEPAHDRSGGDTGAVAQSFDLGKCCAQLMVR